MYKPVVDLVAPSSNMSIAYSSTIAQTQDKTRAVCKERIAYLVRLIESLVRKKDVRMLDLGCGTGVFTIPLATHLGYETAGADRSPQMLDVATKKTGASLIRWDVQDVTSLTYKNNQFDVIFIANLLHHLPDGGETIRDCVRILKPGGILINHCGALEDVLESPELKFFPAAVEIDALRTPTKRQVENWMREAGLANICSETASYREYSSAEERVRAIEQKHVSVLHMLDKQDFADGLQKLHTYANKNSKDPWLQNLTMTTTYARLARDVKPTSKRAEAFIASKTRKTSDG